MNQQNHSGTGHNINADTVYINSAPNISSDLTSVVNILSKKIFLPINDEEKETLQSFNPDSKITYNNVVRFKSIIDIYKIYVGKLSSIYKEFDNQGTDKTHIVLENIKLCYLKEKALFLQKHLGEDEISVIKEYSDDIIDSVENSLKKVIVNSSNISCSTESINISLTIVLVDAFIRCKILEEPK